MNKREADRKAKELRERIWQEGRAEQDKVIETWLEDQEEEGWTVVYISQYRKGGGSTFLAGMLVKTGIWEKMEGEGIEQWSEIDEGWVYMGGEIKQRTMEWGGERLEEGFAITYRGKEGRGSAEGATIDQRIVKLEGLWWDNDLQAWGRKGREGEVEEMILCGEEQHENGETSKVVMIKNDIIHSLKDQGGMEVVQYIDSVWAEDIFQRQWEGEGEGRKETELGRWRWGKGKVGGWVRGCRRQRERVIEEDDEGGKAGYEEYPEFICWPYNIEAIRAGQRKSHEEVRKCKARSEDLRNYFEDKDERCLEFTPAFFDAKVLEKYTRNYVRYKVREGSITDEGLPGWYLEYYDINDEGQVHTFLRHMERLPLKEQRHWEELLSNLVYDGLFMRRLCVPRGPRCRR